MAVSNTPTLREVATELGLTGTVDLIQCLNASVLADKSLPVDLMRFAGYVHVPLPPESVNITTAASDSFLVTWVPGSGNVDSYEIQRSTNGGGFQGLTEVPGNITIFEDKTVVTGFIYQYRVRAKNSAGVSAWTLSGSRIR